MVDLERFIAPHRATRQLDYAFLREVDDVGGGGVELAERPVALLPGEPGSGRSYARQRVHHYRQGQRPEWVVHVADLLQHGEYSLAGPTGLCVGRRAVFCRP